MHAERAGAAAVMIVPPFYDALSWRELLAHYTAVADAIAIPIMYYNLPSATGVTLTAEQLRELPVACLKDTGGDAIAATELIQTDGPTLLNGWDTLTFAALAAGVRAVVWGTASIIPEQCVELHRLLIDDIDLPAARELWARIWPLCRFLEATATRPRSRPGRRSPATPPARSARRCSRSTTRRSSAGSSQLRAVGHRRHAVVPLEGAAEVELVIEARAERDLAHRQVGEAQQPRGLEHHAVGDQLLGRAAGDVAQRADSCAGGTASASA